MKKLVLCLMFVLGSAPLFGQTATPTQKFAWDIQAPDLATAQGYTYKYYQDGATTGQTFSGVTCATTATTGTFTCSVAVPAFTPGNHTVSITASNVAGESAKSSPFAFTFVAIPAVPGNIRLQ